MVSVCRALQLRAFRDCRRFQQRTADIVAAQEAWLATADRLRDDYVRVTSSVDSVRPLILSMVVSVTLEANC
jgi:hypothetical protein